MRLILRAASLIALCALALLFAPVRADAAPLHGAPETYIVQPGDTLFSIATRYHTTVAALKQLNNLSGDMIQVGQKLLVPTGDTAAGISLPVPMSSAYVVQPGDTLYRIALRYGTTPRAILQLNGISNPNLIEPGQALAIPNSTIVAKPGLIIDPPTARQGGTLLIQVARPDATSVTGRLNGQPIPFTRAGGYFYALVGISRCAKVGSVPLVITTTDTAGQSATESTPINIASAVFIVQNITLPPGKASLLDPALLQREDAQLTAIVARYTPSRLWSGAWRQPVYGDVTSAFGSRRSYNGGPVGACGHEGTDFDMDKGAVVYAPARGRVMFADLTQVRGNMIVIDHGIGVFSAYFHLSEINTQVEQMVEPGTPIGKVGSTGLSTGPHLHWSVWVNGEYVDPLEWTRRLIP